MVGYDRGHDIADAYSTMGYVSDGLGQRGSLITSNQGMVSVV